MNFQQIYIDTLKYWPDEILISDAEMVDANSGKFPTLSRIWDHVERKTVKLEAWTDLMVWAIFCGLHKLAIDQYHKKKLTIYTKDVDLEYIKYKFEESFFDNEYRDLWVKYKK